MKCPNCGADIDKGRFCSFCGSQISYDMRREQEQINKAGCPLCGSSNVEFSRESHGEVNKFGSKQILWNTVGLCKDCGYTWYTDEAEESITDGNEDSVTHAYDSDHSKQTGAGNVYNYNINYNGTQYNSAQIGGRQPEYTQTQAAPAKNNMVWWVLGWIFFFPAPVMVLIWRKKNTWSVGVKLAVTVAFWVFVFIIGSLNNSNEPASAPSPTPTPENNITQPLTLETDDFLVYPF